MTHRHNDTTRHGCAPIPRFDHPKHISTIGNRFSRQISRDELSFSTIDRIDRHSKRGRRLTTMNRFRHDNEKRKSPAKRRSWLPAAVVVFHRVFDNFPFVGVVFFVGQRKVAPSFEELSSSVFSDVAKTRKTCCNGFTADYASRVIRDRIHGNIPIVHRKKLYFDDSSSCEWCENETIALQKLICEKSHRINLWLLNIWMCYRYIKEFGSKLVRIIKQLVIEILVSAASSYMANFTIVKVCNLIAFF